MNILLIPPRSGALLPAGVKAAAARAARGELSLLAVLAADPALGMQYESHLSDLAALSGISESKVESALQFWRGAGVLTIAEEDETPTAVSADPSAAPESPASSSPVSAGQAARPRALLSNEIHHYTGIELESLLCANNGSLRHLIDECQNMAGKIFTPTDVNRIVYLSEQLGMESEHILLLFTYCIERGKKTVAYLERTAVNLFNEGVDTAEAFEAYLKRNEELASFEGKLRTLLGVGGRAWTANEKKYIQTWQQEWACSIELVECAYQICVDSKGSFSFPYVNRILENWNAAGR